MNFAPRVKVPVLMVNGRYDFVFPLETCQSRCFVYSERRRRTRSMSCMKEGTCRAIAGEKRHSGLAR